MKERFYRACRILLRAYFAIFLPLNAKGQENIPESGAAILCGNHISLLDPLSIAVVSKRAVNFMGKKELFAFKPFAALLKALNAFPVDRRNNDMSAMRTAMAILKNEGVLGIFPEGGRVKEGAESKLETGVGLVAIRSRAAVVPVRIFGPYRLFRKTRIVFGPPLELDDLFGRADSGALTAAMKRIEEAIFSLG